MGKDAGTIIIHFMGLLWTKKRFWELIYFKQYIWRPFLSLVMVVEGGGLGDHGILCTFVGDGMREGEITPSQIITEGGWGLPKTAKEKNLKSF